MRAIDDIVVDQKIAALDQLDAHLAREEGVLEKAELKTPGVSTAIETSSWNGASDLQRREKLVGIVLDRPHARGAEHVRERRGARHRGSRACRRRRRGRADCPPARRTRRPRGARDRCRRHSHRRRAAPAAPRISRR